ncbi:type IV pilus modification protein PilV [Azoarcus indigens]|nr:type IV pilus modification protein PilV [Azoarcus indigens]NMG63688.1 type IV pilus modification protein PilV [Azoarcus indigens]
MLTYSSPAVAIHPYQKGVSLIEVLIAVLVLSLGLLGMAGLQFSSLRNNQSATERSMAVILSYSILDRMRANRSAVLAGNYNFSDAACTAPTGTNLAETDLAAWLASVQQSIGAGSCGSVSCDGAGLCTVSITWDDSRGSAADATAAQSFSIQTKAQL